MDHKKILLVDDDADDQLVFKDVVNEIAPEIECVTASNGLEAMVYLTAEAPVPFIIFLDLNMPLMNGFECLKCIKKEDRLKEIPVVIFTTSNDPMDQERTKDLGAEIFFTKTANFNLFKAKMLEILKTDFSKPVPFLIREVR